MPLSITLVVYPPSTLMKTLTAFASGSHMLAIAENLTPSHLLSNLLQPVTQWKSLMISQRKTT